jgi:hypothetical protein
MTSFRAEASDIESGARRSPEDVLHQVLEPGEQIIWSGRPDVSAMVQGVGTKRFGSAGPLVVLATTAAAAWLIARRRGLDTGALLEALTRDGAWVYVLVAIAIMLLPLLLRMAGVDLSGAKQHRKWARSLTYGITDRRLLILEDDEIEWACEPDDLGPIRLHERTPTHGDLVFRQRSGGGEKQTVYSRDRQRIGFKALPDPERLKEVVERWREAHRTGAERQAASFLEPVEWAAAVEEGAPSRRRRVENPRYGLTVTFPEAWEVEVRKRGAPYGKFAFELEKWLPLEDSTDWNVIRGKGPYHTSVEIHLDVVPEPVVSLEEMMDSWIYKAFAGELLDTDDAVRWGRFRGFSATRRHVEHAADQGSEDIERPAFMRSTFLHDGRLQVGITVTWPEGSDPLEAVVDKVVREMTLTELDEYAPLAATPSEAAKYFGWLVMAGRVMRVFFGLLFFGSGAWMIPAIGGLMVMLRPLALPFEVFRGFTRAPFGKRVLITVGLSVAIVLLIGALLP